MIALFLVVLLVHPQPPVLAVGSAAPVISLRTPLGQQQTVVRHGGGRVTVVEFVEAGCVTCQEKAAELCADAAAHPAALVAGVAAGNESAGALTTYVSRHVPAGCAMTFVLDPGLAVSRSYEVAVVPTVYVIDKSGNIYFGGIGGQAVDSVANALQQVDHG